MDHSIVQTAPYRAELEALVCSRAELVAMLSREHRFSSLRLDELSGPELDKLARFARVCRAPAGSVVFEEGAPDPYLCLIVEGEIEVRKEDASRAVRALATLGAGKLLGFLRRLARLVSARLRETAGRLVDHLPA